MNDGSTTTTTASDFEKLGAFYLGRAVAGVGAPTTTTADSNAPRQPFLYDARNLTTHAVVIGMTGSGKTGLSIALLEEAAIDGIPAIVVDPKGDLGNLLLTFPSLSAEEFAPWVPHGSDAADEAKKWSEGLASWGQDAARIKRLRDAAEIVIYTPGSRAGLPISITGSLAAPPPEARADQETFSERIGQTATSLLGLVGIQAEPGKSREHVLVATILQRAWMAGEDLDLAGLVLRIQDPPFDKLGVLGLESFFPKKERFDLAVAYNSLLATPGFDAWLDGPPLDVGKLLWTKEGKPRIAILSIAHLGDAERMFFVSLLLGQIVSWMRAQPGTPSLRALFFMDEVVGYFPPVAMPPSKRPLLMLLKQARAFGLGIVLATQNPVDLDYKGLSNAGTWIIGRLQTERDKARVLEGLEGVSQSAASRAFDRDTVDRTLSGLAKRHFYFHNVHAEGPSVVESRWTMAYLRGPLTKEEIKKLSAARSPPTPAHAPAQNTVLMPVAVATTPPAPSPAEQQPGSDQRPVLPPDVPEVFFPTTTPRALYHPMIVGAARVHFEDEKTGLDYTREVMFTTPIVDGPLPVRWEDAKWAGNTGVRELTKDPVQNARFMSVPEAAEAPKSYIAWSKELAKWLARTQGIARLKSTKHKLYSQPNEDEGAFRARLAQLGREARDEETTELRDKFASKLATLEERIKKKQGVVAQGEDQASAQRVDAAISTGGGIFGFLSGRPTARSVAGGVAKAARSASRASSKAKSVARDKDDLNSLLSKHLELQREVEAALAKVASAHDPSTLTLENIITKPKKTGITVHLVALGWRSM